MNLVEEEEKKEKKRKFFNFYVLIFIRQSKIFVKEFYFLKMY